MASCTQIESLLQAYVDGELSNSEKVVVEGHLSECRACSRVFRRQRAESAFLLEVFETHRLEQDLTGSIMAHLPEMEHASQLEQEVNWRVKHPRTRSAKALTLLPVIAPVVLLVLGLVILFSWPKQEPAGAKVGMVTYQEGVSLRSNEDSTHRSKVGLRSVIARAERIETTEDALLMITLAGPSSLKLDSDTRVKVEDARSITVETGQVWLDVSQDKRAFRVSTPAGDIMVFGTVFNVRVDKDMMVVTVSEGEVQVENDVAFTVLRTGDQVSVRPGKKPLELNRVDPAAVMAWARDIQADPGALELFEARIKTRDSNVIRAEQVFVVESRRQPVRSISFRWEPDAYLTGHCGYHIYVTDDQLKPLFMGYVEGKMFSNKDRSVTELVVPQDEPITGVNVLHISVVPDYRTGSIETEFTEVAALSM